MNLVMNQSNHIYLDYAATTPLDPGVLELMMPYFTEQFYNPGGIYRGAVEVKQVLRESREQVASELSARPSEIIFVDGGTEANNLAILGTIEAWKKHNSNTRPHVITTTIEHASVQELVKYLNESCDVTYLEVDHRGSVNPKDLREAINERTVVISVAYANGEIGVIQNVKGITKEVRHYRKHNESVYPYVHVDAAQATNYLNLNVLQLNVDLLSITGSKIYGPKKVAALYVKSGVKLQNLLYGGNQEYGLRPGTENVPYIVGFTHALKKVRAIHEEELKRLTALRNTFIQELSDIPHVIFNTHADEDFLPNIVNLTIPGISSEELVIRLDAKGIDCSMRSACKSGEDGDSHVIKALRDTDTGSVRFSMGQRTTETQIQQTVAILKDIVSSLRKVQEQYGS
jgi:cysteine desulfurase